MRNAEVTRLSKELNEVKKDLEVAVHEVSNLDETVALRTQQRDAAEAEVKQLRKAIDILDPVRLHAPKRAQKEA